MNIDRMLPIQESFLVVETFSTTSQVTNYKKALLSILKKGPDTEPIVCQGCRYYSNEIPLAADAKEGTRWVFSQYKSDTAFPSCAGGVIQRYSQAPQNLRRSLQEQEKLNIYKITDEYYFSFYFNSTFQIHIHRQHKHQLI